MEISPYYQLKCVFVGEPSVGKTSIMNLIHKEKHDPNTEATIGLGFSNTHVELKEYPLSNPENLPDFYKEKNEEYGIIDTNQLISLHLWDTAGSTRFRSIVKSYLRDIDICFLVFDMTKKTTFQDLYNWKEEVSKFSNPLYVLIGNKSDLRNQEITMNQVKELATIWNIKHYIISCVRFNSSEFIKRIIHISTKDFHDKMLTLLHENKKIPEYIKTSHFKKKFKFIEFDDEENPKFCCFQ